MRLSRAAPARAPRAARRGRPLARCDGASGAHRGALREWSAAAVRREGGAGAGAGGAGAGAVGARYAVPGGVRVRRGAGAVDPAELLQLCLEAPSWSSVATQGRLTEEQLARALDASAVVVAVYVDAAGGRSSRLEGGQRLVGCARATSDLALVGELVDLAVAGHWQDKGLGKLLIDEVTAFFLELDISDVGATAPPSAQPFLEGCGFKESYRGCHTLTLGDSAAGQLLLTSGGGAGNTPLRRELVLSPSPELVLSPSPSLATAPAPMVDEKYAAVVRG